MTKKPSNRRTAVLAEADLAVNRHRNRAYGPPEDNFARIARLWNIHLVNRGIVADVDSPALTLADVAMMLVLLKVGRLSETEDHFDSWTDIAGYAACGAEVSEI